MSKVTETKDENHASSPWIRPSEVMTLHRLKLKKKALQDRMNRKSLTKSVSNDFNLSLSDNSKSFKRKNPFLINEENKKPKIDDFSEVLSESTDNTLFKLLNPTRIELKIPVDNSSPLKSFTSALNELQSTRSKTICKGKKWIPIDWTLKSKLRLTSCKPFAWNRTLKTSEESSGITGYVRCLDTRNITTIDTTPNAQFYQCCLYWQHPSLPWLQLFPRMHGKASATNTSFITGFIKESLHSTWAVSLRSLFQLVRARQCPYFYVCANTFTACFRAAGICGYSEMHVLLTPTTRGFRHLLRQEDITFTMPLKTKRHSSDGTVDQGYDTLDSSSQTTTDESITLLSNPALIEEDDRPDEQWLESLGINAEEIKKINNIQEKINHKAECEVDNSEKSLIFVEGVEAHGLYNFLLNCKSIVSTTGSLAGVPPTLLAPVAFHGASLQSLKVRENKIRDNTAEYYSIELSGPILPHTLHSLYSLLPKDCNISATFANISTTESFSKVKATRSYEKSNSKPDMSGRVFFGQENLSDCGLNKEILQHFCSDNIEHIQHYDSLKYSSDTGLYMWL